MHCLTRVFYWLFGITCPVIIFDSMTCEEVLIIPPLAEWWVYWNTLVRPSLNLVYVTSHLSVVGFYSYLVSWLAMI